MKPPVISASYVETSPGVWCHISRVRRVEAGQPEPNGGTALEREAPASKGSATGVGTGVSTKRSRTVSSAGGVVVVTMLAMLRREFDEHDNLRASLKPLVDAIAGSLGVQDNDARVRWQYAQQRTVGRPRVVVLIEKRI